MENITVVHTPSSEHTLENVPENDTRASSIGRTMGDEPLKPALLFCADKIPHELKRLRQWVLWKLEPRKGRGKPTKVPYRANGAKASSTNADTWASFEESLDAYQRGGFSGVGFVFSGKTNEQGLCLCGVDIDHCIVDGVLNADAAAWFGRGGSYHELSQSGEGAHVLGWAQPADGKRNGWEIYSSGRFFALTGHPIPGIAPSHELANMSEPFARVADFIGASAPKQTIRQVNGFTVEQLTALGAISPVFADPADFNDEMLGGIELRKAGLRNIDQVSSVCAFVWDTLDNAGRDCSNPLWFLSLAIASFCEEPEATAHRLSRSHPGYHPDETAQEIARCLKDRQTKTNIGFPSCAAIRGAGATQCAACPHFSLGKSPLSVPGAFTPWGNAVAAGSTPGAALKGKGRYHLAYNVLRASGRKFAYDEFHDRPLVNGKELSDDLCAELRIFIINTDANSDGNDPGKDNVYDAARQLCVEGKFDPIADYLNTVEWDGVARLDAWLINYAGAEDTPLNRAIGRAFLVGVARRVLWPGCKFDTALILEGPQGCGKSTLAKILAGGDENFLDLDVTHLSAKEQQEQIRGRWVIELGELSGMRRGDVNQIKAFMSRTNDRSRPAYGRAVIDQPRRCVFIGTTNNDQYLKDETGNRRFWPVRVGRIDVRSLANDRDVLLAEAVVAARAGEEATLPQELWSAAADAQEERRERDPWEDVLESVTGERITHMGRPKMFIPSATLLGAHLNIPPAQQHGAQSKRARGVMERLGWSYNPAVKIGGVKKRGYMRDAT